ncbi:MAG TPA: hypothetical protein VD846_10395, partial [Allosphingosinicella sp.]|nr:hypothetical protein [Allosphingosinicella sp.]
VGGATRIALYLKFDRPGGFSSYRMFVDHPRIDPFFNNVIFSFKQGCESGFDCRPAGDCPPRPRRDVEIDYLARDFGSLNSALSDFAARYYPEWGERTTADMGVMLLELYAALGDEFAYIQDRYAREAYLETATQRRSLTRLARLVDYVPDAGRNASCLLSLELDPRPQASRLDYADRLRFWAVPEGRPAIPFELGEGLDDSGSLVAHATWNAMALHMPDAGEPCLARGATELLLLPAAGNQRLPSNVTRPGGGGSVLPQDWVGRTMILQSRPADPAIPVRSWPIEVTEVDMSPLDELLPFAPGIPLRLTRIRWDKAQALPYALRIAETRLLGNVAPAVAGRTVAERFRIGAPTAAMSPAVAALPRAVEREGPAGRDCAPRAATMLYGLAASEDEGLNHLGAHDGADGRRPDLLLTDVGTGRRWDHHPNILAMDQDDEGFTLEPGQWRPIVRYYRGGEFVVHADYATEAGWTVRFGGGEFGRIPEDGTVFEAAYRTALGARSNVAAGAVSVVAPPDGTPPAPALAPVARVFNPLPATGGVDPESAERIRQRAPEFRDAFPLNAVQPRHFREIVEREDWVQTAGASTRWVGSWPRHFVTADPSDSVAYTREQRRTLEDLVDSVRMAGRDATVRDPVYVPLDLEISICVEDGHYAGQVLERAMRALAGEGPAERPAFFDPDNFSFGDPLRRGSLEAAVQAVPGVKGVVGICLRHRGTRAWQAFLEPELRIAMNEIIRVDNDPAHPEWGSLKIRAGASADGAGCACCQP